MRLYRPYDPETLKRVQNAEKDILLTFIRICEKYKLQYFVAFGTLLGTIRHHGFIPWDDDVDVAMPRQDYEKFLQAAQEECGDIYFLQTYETDPQYHLFFAKLRRRDSLFVENTLQNADSVSGIYIDIFPYDNISDDEQLMHKQLKKGENFGVLLSVKRVREPQIGNYGRIKTYIYRAGWAILHWILNIWTSDQDLWGKAMDEFTKYDSKHTDRLTTFSMDSAKWMVKADEIAEYIQLPFEDITVNVPKGYDAILTRSYGDYMQLPPENERVNHMPVRLKFPGEPEQELD